MNQRVLPLLTAVVLAAGLIARADAAAGTVAAVPVVSAVDTRTGPGAHYAAGAKLLAGANVKPLRRQGDWVYAQARGAEGWIPAFVLQSEQLDSTARVLRSASKSLLRSLTSLLTRGDDRVEHFPRANLTLGIRGFAQAYAKHRGVMKEPDAALWEEPALDPQAFDAFVGSRFSGRDWDALKRRLPLDQAAPMPHADADRLGAALANVLAGQHRLRRDRALERYLSLVATLVAASSHAFDVPVRVYIIDSRQPLGYVTPHGIVFVSTGALGRMRSEAEFAFFVGHEIAHVAFAHGHRKLERDEERSREASAFAEMETDLGWDERTEDPYVRTANELSELADQIHEYFQREDNDADELEADRWGLIYAARAGYVPEAAESVLVRLVSEVKGEGLLWQGTGVKPRLAQVRRSLTTVTIERVEFRAFADEYAAAVRP